MNINEIIAKVVLEFPKIDFSEDLKDCSFPEHILSNFHITPYYKCFATYVKLFNVKKVLELGTCTGISSLALAKYADHVDTYDISDQYVDPGVLKNPKIKFHLLKTPEEVLEISYVGYDLIFVDIDHSGQYEPLIHEKLCREYKGIVFYDDVNMPEMRSFWKSIQNEKQFAFWNRFGTGIVCY